KRVTAHGLKGDKRTELPRPRRWPSLACPVEWQDAGRTGKEPEGGCPLLGSDFLHQLSAPKAPRFRRGQILGIEAVEKAKGGGALIGCGHVMLLPVVLPRQAARP